MLFIFEEPQYAAILYMPYKQVSGHIPERTRSSTECRYMGLFVFLYTENCQ